MGRFVARQPSSTRSGRGRYVNSYMSADAHARLSREERLGPDRCAQLDQLAAAVSEEVADNMELRYVIDALRDRATKAGEAGRSKVSG